MPGEADIEDQRSEIGRRKAEKRKEDQRSEVGSQKSEDELSAIRHLSSVICFSSSIVLAKRSSLFHR